MSLNFQWKSFKTRVARRVFVLFIVCAIVPISVLGGISYTQVKRNLEDQHRLRLRRESRAVALSIYERLHLLREQLVSLAATGAVDTAGRGGLNFTSWWWEDVPPAADETSAFSLTIRPTPAGPEITMGYRTGNRRLLARIDAGHLWAAADRVHKATGVLVLRVDGSLLYATDDAHAVFVTARLKAAGWPRNGTLVWDAGGSRYYAGYAVIFLEPLVPTPSWVVAVVTADDPVTDLMRDFRWTFPALVVFSLGLVFMLGQYLIRRSTEPIEILKEGTRHIAEGDFGYEVDIRSSDEFEDLGNSFNDMSRRLKEGQSLLIRAARMGTMGQMASGIIHEVKQPLSAVYGLVQLVMLDTQDARSAETLQTVLKAVEGLDTSLNRFRSFSQDTPVDMRPLDLNEIVEEVFRLLAIRFRKRNIECRLKLAPGLPKITGDRRGLQQVLSNLMINALDALEETRPASPQVLITTRLSDGQVVLAVSDNAGGIPEEIQNRIFDPFFTTKSEEKGTGLGMAIVDAIVHQHGADISFESVTGEGTTFRIAFSLEAERTAA